MKKNCLNWFLSAAFLFLLGSCANKVKPGQEPEVKEKFTFAYFTDVHLNKDNRGNGDVALRMALSDAKNKRVDFILFGGDNADTDALGDAEHTADSLHERFKSIVDEAGIPLYFTIGNHDRYYRRNGETDTLGFGLFEKYFGNTFGSFDHKGVHFITLNGLFPCEKGPYSVSPEEMEWLKSDLQKVGKEVPVVVSIHVLMLSLYYPVVEGNFKGADMICNTKDVFEVLNGYNVQLVLQGHQHIYEQIQERNRWFVTAGAVSAYWWGGAFLETEEGYLLVRVDENNRFSWEYVDYGWSVGNNNN